VLFRSQAVVGVPDSAFRILSPLAGSTFILDPDIRSSRRIPLTAVGANRLRWESDSLVVEQEGDRAVALGEAGVHRIVVTDLESGAQASTMITVSSL
jgi:hypothetical protein